MLSATFSLLLILETGAPALPAEAAEELLRSSDVSTLAPESFRARLAIRGSAGAPLNLEVWRAGEGRTLVRFLDAKDRGKYLLKRDSEMFFLSPRAKKPVKLDRSYKLSGAASLDEILGTHYAREYKIAAAAETDDGLAALDLEAKTSAAPYPRARYLVKAETQRPVRVEFTLANGKVMRSVEFLEWADGANPHPRRLRVTDTLRPKANADVEIIEVNERPVPAALFSLEDASARAALEAPGSR